MGVVAIKRHQLVNKQCLNEVVEDCAINRSRDCLTIEHPVDRHEGNSGYSFTAYQQFLANQMPPSDTITVPSNGVTSIAACLIQKKSSCLDRKGTLLKQTVDEENYPFESPTVLAFAE